jgi:hypothetical protein
MPTKQEIEQARKNLDDPWWRLNNLYWIIGKEGEKVKFKCNWAQEELYNNTWHCNIILKARQLGISTYVCILFLDRCLFNDNLSAGIIAHTMDDAAYMFKRIKFAYDSLDLQLKAYRSATVDSARELVFNNGSSLRVGTSMRGSTLQYLHISEFGKISAVDTTRAREIVTGSLNTLAAGQFVFIESTAEGRDGYFYDMCQEAQALKDKKTKLTKLDYLFHFFPWYKCKDYFLNEHVVITKEQNDYFESLERQDIKLSLPQKQWYVKKQATQQEDMKREYPSTPAESFETAITGAYYAQQLSYARQQGRISEIYYSEDAPVHTCFDLGYGDSTAIWLFQIEGKEIHFLEYIEGNNESLVYYLKLLKEKRYIYGTHLVPHDAAAHEYGSGLTRIETARKNGFTFTLVSDIPVDEGIDATRYLFPRFWFDESKCGKGVAHLDNYKRSWNAKLGCWGSKPLHNDASHCADALRTLTCGIHLLGDSGVTDDWVERMVQRHNPYGL